MMVFLLYRINIWQFWTLIYFVATMSCPHFSNSSDLSLNMGKLKFFIFLRSHRLFNPPPLDLTSLGDPILHSKEIWWYLGFIFDRKLTFQQHINFYANKTLSTVKCMKLLGNSSRGLISTQKQLLYRSCVLLIALYGF